MSHNFLTFSKRSHIFMLSEISSKSSLIFIGLVFMSLLGIGCAGIKVINPNEQNQNKGTLALDTKDGQIKLVETYTCKLESMGKRFSAIGKSEEEARSEVVAKCKDATVLSFCKSEKVTCLKN